MSSTCRYESQSCCCIGSFYITRTYILSTSRPLSRSHRDVRYHRHPYSRGANMNDNMNNDNNSKESYPKSTQSQDQIPESPTPKAPPSGLWSGEEAVGSITSPCETGRYRMVLRDYAATVQIEGSLVTLDYTELDSEARSVKKTVLCQVSRMRSQNVHHENRILGALLRERGRIPGLSGFA